MTAAPVPKNESDRIKALRSYEILDSAPELTYDDFTHLAADLCDVPISFISLVDSHRQWFKSRLGTEVCETKREHAFCAHTILQNAVMVIPDTSLDERFHDSPLVLGSPYIRFYAGAPLTTPDGHAIGSLCVVDTKPRQPTRVQIQGLEALARQVMHLLELQRTMKELATALERVKTLEGLVPICCYCHGVRDDRGFWNSLEKFMQDNSDFKLSHGICPDCAEKYYPGIVTEADRSTTAS